MRPKTKKTTTGKTEDTSLRFVNKVLIAGYCAIALFGLIFYAVSNSAPKSGECYTKFDGSKKFVKVLGIMSDSSRDYDVVHYYEITDSYDELDSTLFNNSVSGFKETYTKLENCDSLDYVSRINAYKKTNNTLHEEISRLKEQP